MQQTQPLIQFQNHIQTACNTPPEPVQSYSRYKSMTRVRWANQSSTHGTSGEASSPKGLSKELLEELTDLLLQQHTDQLEKKQGKSSQKKKHPQKKQRAHQTRKRRRSVAAQKEENSSSTNWSESSASDWDF
ncbi:ORF3 [Torque teno Tadarida brasiliensis virus]|uniref:ORF3 n=1 Tax=Torque teno Tadarida brasiliensis virus TaxID=1543419 RepID=A0A088MJF6_9VIRU|nr:ORF3 [Torque teno Tadarida brasiliensis virus]AIN40976.1 ORF3 [Torque teno Tadarida brasiliensis virus]